MRLDSESQLAIKAYKGSVTPGASTRDANWDAIAKRALRGDAPEWVDDANLGPRRRRTIPWLVAGTVAAAAAAIALLVHRGVLHPDELAVAPVSASYETQEREDGASRARVRDQPLRTSAGGARSSVEAMDAPATPDPAADPQSVAPIEVAGTSSVVEEPDDKAPQSRRRASGRVQPSREQPARAVNEPGDPLASIRLESSLVGRARAALRDSDPATALRLVDEHARRFPAGELEEERELLRVTALCDSGRSEAALRAAHAFRRAFPGSPLLGHLESACLEGR